MVAGVTFLALVGAAGFRAVPGVLLAPLQAEFGWSVTTISAAVAVNMALYGLTAPFAAALVATVGLARRAACPVRGGHPGEHGGLHRLLRPGPGRHDPADARAHPRGLRAVAPVVFGWVFASQQVGAALMALVAGAVRDTVGSYDLAR